MIQIQLASSSSTDNSCVELSKYILGLSRLGNHCEYVHLKLYSLYPLLLTWQSQLNLIYLHHTTKLLN
jgi:hypothetical protein